MGKPNQSTLAPHFLLFAPHFPHNTPFPPISSHFPLISPHFRPFPPISPHFSWYRVHFGYVAGYITTHLVRVFLRPTRWLKMALNHLFEHVNRSRNTLENNIFDHFWTYK